MTDRLRPAQYDNGVWRVSHRKWRKSAPTGGSGLPFEVVLEGVYLYIFVADAMWKIFATTGHLCSYEEIAMP